MCAVNCRNDHCYASRAQKPHFCVKTTKNVGKIAHSDTKTSILCSKGRKMGSRSQKAHKNADFVLGVAQISTERPSAAGKNLPKRDKTAWNEAQRPEAQRNATATQRTQHNTTQHTQRNCNATQLHNGEQQKRRQPFGLSPLKIGGYLLSHMVVQYHRRK